MTGQMSLEDIAGYSTIRLTGPLLDARSEIVRMRAAGYGPRPIARSLNARGIPTPTGRGCWHHSSVIRHVDPDPWRRYIAAYRARR